MSKVYKVWVHVEEIDEDEGHYEDVGIPESIGEFETQEEATALQQQLVRASWDLEVNDG